MYFIYKTYIIININHFDSSLMLVKCELQNRVIFSDYRDKLL